MAFIVPGVCRYTINGTLETFRIANIIDMEIDTTGSTMLRSEAVEAQCGVLINQWADDILPHIIDDYRFDSVSWVDLDDEDGTTGERTSTDDVTLPVNGIGTDPPAPNGISLLVKKVLSGSSRARRNGRMYVTGMTETFTDGTNANNVEATYLPILQDAFSDFLDNINQTDGGPTVYTSHMCVVHILTRDDPTRPGVPGTPLTGDHTNVSELVVDGTWAYQRRRGGR